MLVAVGKWPAAATATSLAAGHLPTAEAIAVPGEVLRPKDPKRHILLKRPRNGSRGKHPRRVGVNQNLHHHRRLIGGVATTVTLIRRIERAQVERIDKVADVMGQMSSLTKTPLPVP